MTHHTVGVTVITQWERLSSHSGSDCHHTAGATVITQVAMLPHSRGCEQVVRVCSCGDCQRKMSGSETTLFDR